MVSFFMDLSSEMAYPLIPLFLAQQLGATPFILGIIEGIAESLASLMKVWSGQKSDRNRRRKPFAITGYGLSAVAKLALAVAGSWGMILGSRVLDRFGKGVRSAPRDALLAESIDASQRGHAYGLHKMLDMLGATLGIVVAYVLIVREVADVRQVFYWSVAPAVIAVLLLFFVKERRSSATAASKPATESTQTQGSRIRRWVQGWQLLDGRLKRVLLLYLIFTLGNSSNQFLLLRAHDVGVSTAGVLLLYMLITLVQAVLAWPIGRLSDRWGRKGMLVVGHAVFGLVYLMMAWISQPRMLVLAFVGYGLFGALTAGVQKALLVDLAPSDQKATVLGLYGAMTGLALLPASILAGALWTYIDVQAPFFFSGALGLLTAVGLGRILAAKSA